MRDPRKVRRLLVCSLVAGSALALVLATQALAAHPRPGSGTPYRIPLVQAFAACPPGGAGTVHVSGWPPPPGAPPPFNASCPGPAPQSGLLTTGTGGVGAGFLRLTPVCMPPSAGPLPCLDVGGDQEDVTVAGTMTDVRCAGAAPGCPGAMADYVGPTFARFPIRITDHAQGPAPGPNPPCPFPTEGVPPCITGTVVDLLFDVLTPPCVPVGAPGGPPGSTCTWATSLDAMAPVVFEFQRMNFRTTDEVVVMEPGPDGMLGPFCPPVCGTGDEGITRAEGWFTP
jgi:hypothetical protein